MKLLWSEEILTGMKVNKKAMSYYVIVSLILALVVFFSYSFFTKGVVYNYVENVGLVEEDVNESLECIVEPYTKGDEDGDGVKDTDECEGVKEGSLF